MDGWTHAALTEFFTRRLNRFVWLRDLMASSVVQGTTEPKVLDALSLCIHSAYTDLCDLGERERARATVRTTVTYVEERG